VYDRRVFQHGSSAAIILGIVYWCVGLLVGAAVGAVTSLFLTKEVRMGNVFKDGLAGSVGFLAGVTGVALVPVPPHTVMYYSNGSVATTTTFRYQHPYPVAFAVACLLPLLRELYLLWRGRRAREADSMPPAS
jgi:hypothetical protein